MSKKARAQTFRAGVGAIIINNRGKVLAFERRDFPDSWQLPQGGLDEDESPREAVNREIQEETGIESDDLQVISESSRLLAYELPPEARNKKIGRGQVHYWFLFRFTGQDVSITLGNKKEFSTWKWMSMDELTNKVVAFKQPVYKELAKEFKAYIK